MRIRSVVAASLIVLALGLTASPAAAGGWAVSTLDEVPDLTPGATVDIGITVRSHGVNPMSMTGPMAQGFGITFVAEDGERSFFPAVPDGPEGHHVARVVVPVAGTYRWEVSGSLAGQDLGTIVIGSDSVAPSITSSGSATTSPLTWWTAGLAVVLALLAMWDLLRGRRTAVPSRTAPAA